MRFYGFLRFFGTFARKEAQTSFVLHELGTQHYLVNIIVLKWLEFKITIICLKLRVKLSFYGFLRFFGTFTRKEAQTSFVLHGT